MPKLRITIGDESFDRDLTKPLSVAGRNPDLEIPLPTVSASREHFRIGRLKDGTWAIEDLGSMQHDKILAELIRMLGMRSPEIQKEAARQLAKYEKNIKAAATLLKRAGKEKDKDLASF